MGIFRFLKFVYINVVAFKVVSIRYIYALVPALLPILETPSNSIFGIAFSSIEAPLMESMFVKGRPFKVLVTFRNRKKSHGVMSVEYGGWCIVTVLLWSKTYKLAMMCELVHDCGVKSINCFSTNTALKLQVVLFSDRMT